MDERRRRHRHLDRLAQDYCQTLAQMQDVCEQHNLNFRSELMALAEQWIEQHTRRSASNKPNPAPKDHG